jgi:hypothetical protein
LGLSFFGLTSSTIPIARANLFTQIHEICFHGKGGYDWDTIYNMPRWLRLFTFNKIKEFYDKENEGRENANKDNNTSTLIDSLGNVNRSNWDNAPKKITPGAKTTKPKTTYK